MKSASVLLPLLLCAACFTGKTQNVGIGVLLPTQNLSVAKGLNIDHDNENPGNTLLNGLRFGNTASVSQMVGISSNRAGASPFSMDFYTNNMRRMTIQQNGLVGIGTTPVTYALEVAGTIKTGSNLRADFDVIAQDDVTAGDAITAGTTISAGTSISAGTNITAAGNIAADGNLTANGRGVIMNNGAARLKYASYSATLSVNSLASEASVVGTVTFSAGTFTSPPTAYVANVTTPNGEYYKALLVIEDVTISGLKVRVVNPTPNPISFTNASWRVVAIGPY